MVNSKAVMRGNQMNLAVFGAKGRVGKKIADIAVKRGHNVWQIDKNFSENQLDNVDAVICFTTAEGTHDVVEFCNKHCCPLVLGTTGLNEAQQALVDGLSKRVTVVQKANFAIGVDMLYKLCDIVSRELKWDCAVVETHRRGKKDAPSGTARGLASAISGNLGSFSSVEVHSLRVGSNFGKHEVTFATDGESLTITHQAENVDIFALGAIKTAEEIIRDL